MFVTCCIFYPISLIKNRLLFCGIICFLATANILFCKYIWSEYLPWHLSVVGIACFWMGSGYLIKEVVHKETLNKFLHSKKVFAVIGILYFLFQCIAFLIFKADYVGFSDFTETPVLYFLLNGSGVVLIAFVSNFRYPKWISKFLVFIGQNTLFYFAFHGKVQSVIMKIIDILGMSAIAGENGYLFAPVITIFEALVLIVPCVIFSKYLPFAVGKGRTIPKKHRC